MGLVNSKTHKWFNLNVKLGLRSVKLMMVHVQCKHTCINIS